MTWSSKFPYSALLSHDSPSRHFLSSTRPCRKFKHAHNILVSTAVTVLRFQVLKPSSEEVTSPASGSSTQPSLPRSSAPSCQPTTTTLSKHAIAIRTVAVCAMGLFPVSTVSRRSLLCLFPPSQEAPLPFLFRAFSSPLRPSGEASSAVSQGRCFIAACSRGLRAPAQLEAEG